MSFILRLIFGQGVIVGLILFLKALYAWYRLAKGVSQNLGPVLRATRDQLRKVRLYVLVIPVIVLSSIGTVIWIWGIAALVHKQIAAGGAYSSAPYGLFALLLGIAGISILVAVTVFAVSGSESEINYTGVAFSVLPTVAILSVIVAVVVSQSASRPSSSGGVSGQPSAASSRDTTMLALRCDPNLWRSDCGGSVGTGSGDGVALDIIGQDVYSLCNMGYSLHFTDNHGDHLGTISGNRCMNAPTVDTSMYSGLSYGPWVSFQSPENSTTGNPLCGRWVIRLQVEDPTGTVRLTASYRTTVSC